MSWANIIFTLLAIAGTLAGAWLGANRTQHAALALYERQLQDQIEAAQTERRNIRLLLWHENERNLQKLRDFWGRVDASIVPQRGYSVPAEAFEKRYALASLPLPEIGHLMWNTYAARLADVLPNLEEVGGCYELHASLDAFTTLQHTMQAAFQDTDTRRLRLLERFDDWKRGILETDPTGKAITPFERDLLTFQQRTQPTWDGCYAIYIRWRPEGANPIHLLAPNAPATTTQP